MRNDLPSAIQTALAFLLIAAGVATWTVGGALVVAGLLLALWTQMFELRLVDDEDVS